MPKPCEECGDCCRKIYFRAESEYFDVGYLEWIRLHGLKTVMMAGILHVEVPIPCKALSGDKCSIYEARPEMCRLSTCMKDA